MTEETLKDLIPELNEAKMELETAETTERAARTNATAAKNRYNEVTKKLDSAVEELKKQSPRETDWWNDVYRTNTVRVEE